jgi:hypothetical protein
MAQQNLSKAKKILDLFVKVALWIFALIVLALNVLQPRRDLNIDFDMFSTIISAVSFIILILWKWFDTKLWKRKMVNKHLEGAFKTPIIEGRWEGTLIRDGEAHPFVIEIVQTFTSVYCTTFSNSSKSASVFAEILLAPDGIHHQLVFHWKGKTSNTRGLPGDSTGEFLGLTVLDITLTDPIRLEGSYFTDRQPHQTHGTISVRLTGKQIKNCFSEHNCHIEG